MKRAAAGIAAMVIALTVSTSGGPIQAAGPPLRYLASAASTLDPAFIMDDSRREAPLLSGRAGRSRGWTTQIPTGAH